MHDRVSRLRRRTYREIRFAAGSPEVRQSEVERVGPRTPPTGPVDTVPPRRALVERCGHESRWCSEAPVAEVENTWALVRESEDLERAAGSGPRPGDARLAELGVHVWRLTLVTLIDDVDESVRLGHAPEHHEHSGSH